MNQMVRSPRRTSARSYAGQFVTRYLVLYVGWTFERFDIMGSLQEQVMYPTDGSPTGWISIHAPTPIPNPVILLRMLQAVRTSLRCASAFPALSRPPNRLLYL